ncbi:TPA: hypothetical protein ACH3X1_011539 [Trebouxia sp. C0004]
MPETKLSPEAPADPTASQKVNSTYAQGEAVPVEEANRETSHHAAKPSRVKSTFKNVLRQPAPAKPAATLGSQKAQAHPAPHSPSSMVQSVPSHPKAAPMSSRLVPSTSEAAPIVARCAPKPDPVPYVGQEPKPVLPASVHTISSSSRATPIPMKASIPSEKAEPALQKAAVSPGKASGAPDKAKAGSSAKKAAVKPAAKLKPAASVPGTPVTTASVLPPVKPLVSVPSTASAASGSQTPLPSAVAGASIVAGSQRSAQVLSGPLDPPPMQAKAAPPLTLMGPSEPLEAPSAPVKVPSVAQAARPGAPAAPSLPINSPLVPAEAHAKQGPAPLVPIKTPSAPGDLPSQAKATPASQAAAPLVAVGTLPKPMQDLKAAPTAPLEVLSMTKAAPSALALGPSVQKAHLAVPEAAAAASAATTAVESEGPMRWTQDFGRVLARLSPADSSKAIKLPTDFASVGFSVNDGLRLQKSHNRVYSQSGIALLKNKKGPEIAFEAFSVLDGFGQPSAPLHALKTLVPSVLEALNGSKLIAWARRDPSDQQLGFALQVAFMEALPKALLEGYNATDADLRKHLKKQGTMATVAFVCGTQLVVATAGTSCAYLDTGAHIYPMSRWHRAEGPTPGLAPPTVMQVTIPEGGARLIMASGPFWDIATPSQDINNVRKYAAKDAPVKLQAGAVKHGLKLDPTLFVVDLTPATSAAMLIDLQKLCKQKQAQVTQVWQPLEPSSATNKHPEWRCQAATQLVGSAPTDSKLHQPAAMTDQQEHQVKQSAVPEAVQRQQTSLQPQSISSEQSRQQTNKQQVKQQPELKPVKVAEKLQTGKQQPEKVAEKVQTGKQQPEKLPQQASDKQQAVKQQPKKPIQQVTGIKVTIQQQPEKQQVVQPTNQSSAKQHADKQLPEKLPKQVVSQHQPEQAAQEVCEQQQPSLPAQASVASQTGKQVSEELPERVTTQQPPQKPTRKASELQQTDKQQLQKLPEKTPQQQPQKKSEPANKQPYESQQQAQQPAEQQVKKPQAVQQAQQVAQPDAQSVTTSQSGPEVGPAMMASAPALSKCAKRRMAKQNTARKRATLGCAVLEQEQLLERASREKARRERKQQAELQHMENVQAAEGQHEKVKHAKASGPKPEPQAQGETGATKVVNAEEHHADSTSAPPQSPQAKLSATLHQSQEPQSGNRAGSKGKGGGHGVSHGGSQRRGDTKDLQPSSASGVMGGVSDPPQQQPIPSGRGTGGGRRSSGAQIRGRGRHRGSHSAQPTQQPSTQSQIAPPPSLALVHDTTAREHDSSPTRRVNAARAAAAQATRPIQVKALPANYQRGQSHSLSGAQAQGSQTPGHPFRGHGRARGHKGQRTGHGNGPAATCDAVSTDSHPKQAQAHESHTEEARQPQSQQRQSGRKKGHIRNEGHNAVEQQHDGVHADGLHTMHTDNAPLANKDMSAQQTASSNTQDHMQAAVGFRPQYGRGGVNRAPPGLQQGVNHWQRSNRVTLGLPPRPRQGATGQQQGSVGGSLGLTPGLPVGANSSISRQHDNHHEMENSGGAQSSSRFVGIRIDGVRPEATVCSRPTANRRADGRILQVVCPRRR